MAMLKLATRASALARTQSQWVADQIPRSGHSVELSFIKSQGDADRTSSLSAIGGQGLFTRAVDEAVLRGDADLAVHSLKDLPTTITPGLVLAAVPEREDPTDLLAGSAATSLDELPEGAIIATGSLRRRAQLLAARPDLSIVEIRGNVETRLERVKSEGYAGTVLAAAGLNRLGLTVPGFSLAEILLPAIGQGALGIVCREEDETTRTVLATLDHAPTRAAVTAERAFLRAVEAGCHAPTGARTSVNGNTLHLTAAVFSPDGTKTIQSEVQGDSAEAEALGKAAAEEILSQGGRTL
ncbi:MAG: hydroxymethylbilane synthase, partial [Planctomycetota bacterium]